MRKVILYLLLTLLCMPCGALKIMSVKDRDDSNKHIAFRSGEQVAVHMPEIRKDLIGTIFLATGWSVVDSLRQDVLNELSRRGINARADSTLNGNYLKINLNEFISCERSIMNFVLVTSSSLTYLQLHFLATAHRAL